MVKNLKEEWEMLRDHTWRLLETGIATAEWNMAVDEALLAHFDADHKPVLRLYGWENALSFGRFTHIANTLDIRKVQSADFPYVRRMSGGGILVHGGDLSYTLIIPRQWLRDKGVRESYRDICAFLTALYRGLGHNAEFSCDTHREETRSDICLRGVESYDILIDGKKMGGNAQRHTSNTMLQHGTIPMKIDSAVFNPLFLEDAGLEEAATLEQLGTCMTYSELLKRVQEAFARTFDAQFSPDILTPMEEETVRRLLAEKYSQDGWNLHGK